MCIEISCQHRCVTVANPHCSMRHTTLHKSLWSPREYSPMSCAHHRMQYLFTLNYRHSPKSQYFRDYHRFFLSLTSCQSNTDAINNSIVRRPQSKNCLITVNCKHFQRNLFAVIQTKVFKWFKETYLGHQQKWFGVIFFGLPKVIILQGEKSVYNNGKWKWHDDGMP